jgi:SAM-dependent methyltransferase
MSHTGDVTVTRELFFAGEFPRNLDALLRSRHDWMRPYLFGRAIEVGSGAGLSREYLKPFPIFLSDVGVQPFLDFKDVDATTLPFEDASVDVLIANNVIHHLAHPKVMLDEALRVLKPGGNLVIQEIYASFLMRLVLRAMNHESYDMKVDPLDPDVSCNDPSDPWSANCAVPRLLFDDPTCVHEIEKEWVVVHNKKVECLMFLNSGGVVARTIYVPLPDALLRLAAAVDKVLVRVAPRLFALQLQLVLRKPQERTP